MVMKRNYNCLGVDDRVEYKPPPPPSSSLGHDLNFDIADRTLMVIQM